LNRHLRWQQVLQYQPEFVEILTWNDWGESHYISPNPPYENALPTGSEWYVSPVSHGAWLHDLPYYIYQYKTGGAAPSKDIYTPHITFWYRLNPATASGRGGTVCNQAPWQTTMPPQNCVADAIFFTVFTDSKATVSVSIGGVDQGSQVAPSAGVFHGSLPFNGQTGGVTISATMEDGSTLGPVSGPSITTVCHPNGVNWNAWVGSSLS